PAPGEILPGMRDLACSPVRELWDAAARGSQVLLRMRRADQLPLALHRGSPHLRHTPRSTSPRKFSLRFAAPSRSLVTFLSRFPVALKLQTTGLKGSRFLFHLGVKHSVQALTYLGRPTRAFRSKLL